MYEIAILFFRIYKFLYFCLSGWLQLNGLTVASLQSLHWLRETKKKPRISSASNGQIQLDSSNTIYPEGEIYSKRNHSRRRHIAKQPILCIGQNEPSCSTNHHDKEETKAKGNANNSSEDDKAAAADKAPPDNEPVEETGLEDKEKPEGKPKDESDALKRTELVDETLGDLLASLFEEINIYDDDPHEIIQGLSMQGIWTWNSFIRMHKDDIQELTKPSRPNPVPLSRNSIRMIGHLKDLIWKHNEDEDPEAKEIDTYSKQVYDSYIDGINLRKKNHVAYSVSTSGIPALFSTPTKSAGEKKYEAWNRTIGKRTKSSFEQLKTDDQYLIWKPIFDAELNH